MFQNPASIFRWQGKFENPCLSTAGSYEAGRPTGDEKAEPQPANRWSAER
jgi:hypothetical protein